MSPMHEPDASRRMRRGQCTALQLRRGPCPPPSRLIHRPWCGAGQGVTTHPSLAAAVLWTGSQHCCCAAGACPRHVPRSASWVQLCRPPGRPPVAGPSVYRHLRCMHPGVAGCQQRCARGVDQSVDWRDAYLRPRPAAVALCKPWWGHDCSVSWGSQGLSCHGGQLPGRGPARDAVFAAHAAVVIIRVVAASPPGAPRSRVRERASK
jgi:hypothetical protein